MDGDLCDSSFLFESVGLWIFFFVCLDSFVSVFLENRCAIWIFSVVVSGAVFLLLKFCLFDVFLGAGGGDLM